jgi:hypothetical protein
MISTWSVSKDQVLHSCERRYYFQYAASARMDSKNPVIQEIAFLKKVKNIALWKGALLHSIAAEYIKEKVKNDDTDMKSILDRYSELVQAQWKSSVSAADGSAADQYEIVRKGGLILLEHLAGESIPVGLPELMIDDVFKLALSFAEWTKNTKLNKAMRESSKTWVEPSVFERDAPGFMVDDVRVVAKVDLAVLAKSGGFTIYDWKTGKEPPSSSVFISQPELQASVYQLWPYYGYNKTFDKIRAVFVYLRDGTAIEKEYRMNEDTMLHVTGLIRGSISRMKSLDNIESSSHQQRLDGLSSLTLKDLDFAVSDMHCARCAFKVICRRVVLT